MKKIPITSTAKIMIIEAVPVYVQQITKRFKNEFNVDLIIPGLFLRLDIPIEEYLINQKPDILLLSYNLDFWDPQNIPGNIYQNGADLIPVIKQSLPECIIIGTANANDKEAQNCLRQSGADAVMWKELLCDSDLTLTSDSTEARLVFVE